MGAYDESYRRSLDDPDGFWLEAAEAISWSRPPTRALDATDAPLYRWFPDGALNTSYNALDRHLEAGHGDRTALIYDSPVTGTGRSYTYAQLRDEVATFAGALAGLGVGKGDRVIVYMPMVPEAVIAMLACARLGAIHSVVFGGFAPRELAARIDDATPRVIVAASCGIEPTRVVEYKPIIDEALQIAQHQPEHTIVFQREQMPAQLGERDLDWTALAAKASPADPVEVAATDPLYILTPQVRRGSRRASSATTAVTRSLWPGRCAPSTTSDRVTCGGPPPTSAGSSATRTSSTRRSWSERRRCCTKASRSGRRTRVRSGG